MVKWHRNQIASRQGFLALTAVLAVTLFGGIALAETVFQTVKAGDLFTADGGNAVDKKQVEVQKVDGADGGQVARIKGDMVQWGFVNAWFGQPAPQGKSTVRVRLYVDGQKTAKYALYIHGKNDSVAELKIPDDAKEKTFVSVDVPVDSDQAWSGLSIKKIETSDLPSPWIDTISIVLPN
jgi:hypothetical protein